jgi:restriction endonuclease Mrr
MGRQHSGDKAPTSVPQRLHRTVDVPQANRLENIRQLVAAVREDIQHPTALLELLQVDQRHLSYYRQAASILGVVEPDAHGTLVVTDRGRALLSTAEGSIDEQHAFKDAILAAPALKPFSSFFEGNEVSLDKLAHRLGVLTGLSHSTAKRRAQTLVQWRKFVVGKPDQQPQQLEIPDLAEQLGRLVSRHNALAKQRFLDWLLKTPPGDFEQLAGTLAVAMGYRDVEVVGRSGDGGVDVRAHHQDQWGHPVRAIIQAKRHSKTIGRRIIDEMVGVMAREKCEHAILVTTSDFSAHALKAAQGEPRLRLVSGAQLVDLLATHGVGLRIGQYGEIRLST